MRVLTIIAFVLALTQPVTAELKSNELKVFCESPGGISKYGCPLYVMGVLDGLILGAVRGIGYGDQTAETTTGDIFKSINICLPDGVTPEQQTAIVQKHITQNPERLHIPAVNLIREALSYAFPCSN